MLSIFKTLTIITRLGSAALLSEPATSALQVESQLRFFCQHFFSNICLQIGWFSACVRSTTADLER